MLSGARYSAALPCSDLERAKSFYADKLGLVPVGELPDRLFYQGCSGTEFLLFASSGTASGSHDQMRFSVADIEAEVLDLKRRGVQFQEYDFPGFDKATSPPGPRPEVARRVEHEPGGLQVHRVRVDRHARGARDDSLAAR